MFRATHDRVFAFALRRIDPADAEDVVAETYAVAWRRFEDIPPDALPWLYGVARKTLANYRRSVRRRLQLATRLIGQLDSEFVEPGPADLLEGVEEMRSALGSLRRMDREVLMLVAWEGLDNHDAARVLGISTEAFAVRLHRARKRLAAEIDERGGGRSPADPSSSEGQ